MSSLYFNLLATLLWLKIFTESTAIFLRKVTGLGFPRATLPESGALVSKSVVITGANRGVGLETAKAFARLGATVMFIIMPKTNGSTSHSHLLLLHFLLGHPRLPGPLRRPGRPGGGQRLH